MYIKPINIMSAIVPNNIISVKIFINLYIIFFIISTPFIIGYVYLRKIEIIGQLTKIKISLNLFLFFLIFNPKKFFIVII